MKFDKLLRDIGYNDRSGVSLDRPVPTYSLHWSSNHPKYLYLNHHHHHRFSASSVQGIWRIPVDEIDRPGSFASHMNRSIVLLLEVLYQLKDHDTLLKVSFMLQRTPDQGK